MVIADDQFAFGVLNPFKLEPGLADRARAHRQLRRRSREIPKGRFRLRAGQRATTIQAEQAAPLIPPSTRLANTLAEAPAINLSLFTQSSKYPLAERRKGRPEVQNSRDVLTAARQSKWRGRVCSSNSGCLTGPAGFWTRRRTSSAGAMSRPHMAQGLPSTSACHRGSGALPFQWRWKVSATPGRNTPAQAFGVAGAFREHEARRVRDRRGSGAGSSPTAPARRRSGRGGRVEIRVAAAGHAS